MQGDTQIITEEQIAASRKEITASELFIQKIIKKAAFNYSKGHVQ